MTHGTVEERVRSVMDGFATRCRESAAGSGASHARAVQGAQHLVLVGDDRVWRFPLRGHDCDRLTEMAQRLEAVAGLGLPAPAVLAVVPGPPGRGHLVLARMAGSPLLSAIEEGRDVVAAARQALTLLRATDVGGWPFPQPNWATMWANFAATARDRRGDLPSGEADRLIDCADRAAAVAAQAPARLVHGDLASDNILVDDDGSLAGILDWDGAVVGDCAIDAAAVVHAVSDEGADRLMDTCPWLAADLGRWEVYRDTWELQNLLWKQGLTPPLWGGTEH